MAIASKVNLFLIFTFFLFFLPFRCCLIQVVFCSTICRDISWTGYHQLECGLTDLLHRTNIGKHGLLALQIVLKVDREILENAQDQSSVTDVYDSSYYGTIHRLVRIRLNVQLQTFYVALSWQFI